MPDKTIHNGAPHYMRMFRRPLQLILVVLAFGIILAVMEKPILRGLGGALVAEDTLEPADIIVMPVWAEEAGALEAADLFHDDVAPRVAVLAAPPEPAQLELIRRGILPKDGKSWLTQLLKNLGVGAVEEISDSVTGTESEGQILFEWCNERQFRSIVVVSTPDHSRRLRQVLHRSMKGGTTKVIVQVARYSDFDPNRWWQTRAGTRTEIEEMEKLLLDVVRHPIDWVL